VLIAEITLVEELIATRVKDIAKNILGEKDSWE
jgi:hypothetical protein